MLRPLERNLQAIFLLIPAPRQHRLVNTKPGRRNQVVPHRGGVEMFLEERKTTTTSTTTVCHLEVPGNEKKRRTLTFAGGVVADDSW